MVGSIANARGRLSSYLICFLRLLILVGLLHLPGDRVGAQSRSPGIPRFALPDSGLEWKAPAHPLRFFDVTGRRAGVFGKQTGQFEAWVYPIKLLHGFRLEFRQEDMVEPVHGGTLLEQAIVRPEATTLVYVHPSFTIRQTIWVPLEEPAIVVFFEVDTDKPLVLTAKFVPDFKPMWPASLGGQHSYWLAEEKAFALTDGTGRPTAVVGSPAVGAFTDFMDHQFIGGEMLLQLRILPEQARTMLFPLVMTLSMESPAKAGAAYRDLLGRLRELYMQRVHYHRQFLARTMEIETPEADLNRAFTWAKVALDAGWVCHPTYGCGLVAGYGPSGDGERPGFAWWFGGDALMASWALADYGDLDGAVRALRFLKARQRADGKMMHEMTQSVDLVDWFSRYGFAYYHADTTPMYLYSIRNYWRRSGNRAFLEEFWESAKKAYAYCLSTITPEDGLMDNTKAGLAAVEVGVLRGKVVKDIYLEGFWLAALEAMAELAEAMGRIELREDAIARTAKVRESLQTKWWNPAARYFAFGLTPEGHRADLLGSWPAVLLALSPNFDSDLFREAVAAFALPELATDWGIRWLSNKDPLYDPLSYNNGSVWPFMSGFAAWALYNYGQALPGFATWSATARLTGLLSPGALPELMTGDRFRPGERAVPHQLFSSVGVVVPAVRGLLGLQADAASRKLWFAPNLPANWPYIRFHGFAFGKEHIHGEVQQQPDKMIIFLQSSGSELVELNLSPALPIGARVRRLRVNGQPVKGFRIEEWGDSTRLWLQLRGVRQAEVIIEHEGGIGIVLPAPRPEPGDRTAALKVLRVQTLASPAGRALELRLAGLGGRTYALDLLTTAPRLEAERAAVRQIAGGYRLEISFEGSDYVTQQIRIRF